MNNQPYGPLRHPASRFLLTQFKSSIAIDQSGQSDGDRPPFGAAFGQRLPPTGTTGMVDWSIYTDRYPVASGRSRESDHGPIILATHLAVADPDSPSQAGAEVAQ